jgi:cytoskeletal protein CcmA (bactofilin family)
MLKREKPRRRITDQNMTGASYIDTDTTLSGNLSCDGDLVVAGLVKGEMKSRGSFTLLIGGRWEGNVEASTAILSGKMQGNVIIAGKLEIRKSARIAGSLRAGTIAVAEGAIIDGSMTCTGEAPVIRFEEKRKEDRVDANRHKAK